MGLPRIDSLKQLYVDKNSLSDYKVRDNFNIQIRFINMTEVFEVTDCSALRVLVVDNDKGPDIADLFFINVNLFQVNGRTSCSKLLSVFRCNTFKRIVRIFRDLDEYFEGIKLLKSFLKEYCRFICVGT
jgi:hypothetical protein